MPTKRGGQTGQSNASDLPDEENTSLSLVCLSGKHQQLVEQASKGGVEHAGPQKNTHTDTTGTQVWHHMRGCNGKGLTKSASAVRSHGE